MKLDLWDGEQVQPLPAWASWFIDLGSEIYSLRHERERLTVAVSVPNRRFAALLTALGIVLSSFKEERATPDDPATRLDALQPGMPITLIDLNNKIRFARVMETHRNESGRLTSIKYDRNGHGITADPITRLIDKCTGIDFSASNDVEFQVGRPAGVNTEFTSSLMDTSNYERFVCHNRKSCLIVGEVKSLLEEITEIRFAVNGREPITGALQDLLRARIGNQDQPLHRSVPARSHIIRLHGGDIETTVDPSSFITNACTIFDGGISYQNHRDSAIGNAVVIINRWAAHASESALVFRNDRASSTRDADIKAMRNTPRGIEISGFWS